MRIKESMAETLYQESVGSKPTGLLIESLAFLFPLVTLSSEQGRYSNTGPAPSSHTSSGSISVFFFCFLPQPALTSLSLGSRRSLKKEAVNREHLFMVFQVIPSLTPSCPCVLLQLRRTGTLPLVHKSQGIPAWYSNEIVTLSKEQGDTSGVGKGLCVTCMLPGNSNRLKC